MNNWFIAMCESKQYGFHLVCHPDSKAEKKSALAGIQTQDPDNNLDVRMTL